MIRKILARRRIRKITKWVTRGDIKPVSFGYAKRFEQRSQLAGFKEVVTPEFFKRSLPDDFRVKCNPLYLGDH